jgi:hypothetical protein
MVASFDAEASSNERAGWHSATSGTCFGKPGSYNLFPNQSPTRSAFAIAVRAGFTAPMLGKKLVSTT